MIDVLTNLKYKLDRGSLEQIYFSFIRPKLEYGCHIWDNCTTSNSFALENVQIKVARIVTGARKGTSRELLLTELGWPTLGDRRKGFKLKALINIINKRSPPYLQSLLPARGVDRPESRKANNFKSFKTRSEKFKNSFIPSAISLWNSLSDEQRSYVYCKELIQSYCSPLFYLGSRDNNVKHAQLRLKCSKLNQHLYLLHVIDSPSCLCGNSIEDNNHYLLNCPLYANYRAVLLGSIRSICGIKITCDILLYGDPNMDYCANVNIFNAVHSYIEGTKRL